MNTYEFTLVLGNVDIDTEGLEDTIFEAGCDDSAVCFNGKTVYLDFMREAPSAEQAIASAIAGLKEKGIEVVSIQEAGYITMSGIATMAGLQKSAIENYVKGRRGDGFPAPRYGLQTGTPLYWWPEVAAWLVKNGKVASEFLETASAALKLAPQNTAIYA